MKKAIPLLIAALAAISPPLLAARVAVVPISHTPPIKVYSVYRGSSDYANRHDLGYLGGGWDGVTVVPGVLAIVPGDNWANFVKAAHESPAVTYSIKNVVLEKQTPSAIQCQDIFLSGTIRQQGTPNVRLRWPLMYEVAGTKWTLTILYGTSKPYDDDGPAGVDSNGNPYGMNPASYVHTEVWQWQVHVTIDSLKNLVTLLHELPFGTSQSPVISDEILYAALLSQVERVSSLVAAQSLAQAGLALGEFEMLLMDRCMDKPPLLPNPTGPGTGIAQTMENPACCKLLTDAEYLGFYLNIYQPTK